MASTLDLLNGSAGAASAEPTAAAPLASAAPGLSRWMGWRLRLLFVSALLGCLGVVLLARQLASVPHIDAAWRAGANGRVELAATGSAALQPYLGRALIGVGSPGGPAVVPDASLLGASGRWAAQDALRDRVRGWHELIAAAHDAGIVRLSFDGGGSVDVPAAPRGLGGLPAMCWLLALFALVLYQLAMVLTMARPDLHTGLYAAMALSQAGNLLLAAAESTLDLRLPMPLPWLAMPLHAAFDLVTAAALLHAVSIYPSRLPSASSLAGAGWVIAAAVLGLLAAGTLPHGWWLLQAVVAGYALATAALAGWSYRLEPHPFAMLARRLTLGTLALWCAITLLVGATAADAGGLRHLRLLAPLGWYVAYSALLLMLPFLDRSRLIIREFALLAGVSTVATSLDLLFVAVFSLGQFASLSLSLFVALAVYAGARQWVVNQLMGSSMLTTERMFEQLYRIAREVEAHPERTATLLSQLLREVFEPMEVMLSDSHAAGAQLSADASTLTVPVPSSDPELAGGSVAIRFAQRGRRLFTIEDTRLADRIVEQLRRAVAFDKAVEQGRSEERLRIAQDLHDDIGARLLTLMYTAQSPEIEEYVRHTLQDLKTLTRGLAAPHHRLSHAAAEWKADITQRLSAAHIELRWAVEFDNDLLLSVVQWSALTRVMRELVSNTIAHARATRVTIEFRLAADNLTLVVSDDGTGRNPRDWSHGLGLGGVRKRVKQLGGEVEWRELEPQGIACAVAIRDLSERA